ncbi:alpha/beta fold hydrolase [Alkalicoccobacillus gibsonii]|uniref:alpha/beta fold hydrolase n=1 Tax=Alkalicoccobacillus gibsonii TaxID=79881 RepID=UPI003519CA8B
MPTIYIDHQPIFYQHYKHSTPSAETVVLAHGCLTDHELYNDLLPYLLPHFSVVLYDLRGFGQSALVDDSADILNLYLYARDLHQLLETLELTSGVHLAGFHLGASIMLRYTTMYPDAVKTLCLMGLPCTPPHLVERVYEHRQLIGQYGAVIPYEYFDQIASLMPDDHPRRIQLLETMKHEDLDVYNQMMKLMVYHDPIPDLKDIQTPTMIMTGSNDVLFPPYYLDLQVVSLAHCRSIPITNAATLVMIDSPEPVARKLIRFMNTKPVKQRVNDPLIEKMNETIRLYVEKVHQQAKDSLVIKPGLRIDALSQFRVVREGRELLDGWNKRFSKQILLYLLFHRSTTREQLCEVLWPGTPIDKAKKNLRVYLNYLKTVIGDKDAVERYIVIDREHIHLAGLVESDAVEFTTLLQRAVSSTVPKQKIRLVEEVLASVNQPMLRVSYDEWFLTMRFQIEEEFIELLQWATDYSQVVGEERCMIVGLKKALVAVPDDRIYDCLIELFEYIGDEDGRVMWLKKKNAIDL